MRKNYSKRYTRKSDEQIERETYVILEIAKTMALWLIFITLYWHWF